VLKDKVLRAFGEEPNAESFIAKIMELYPRYTRDQLSIVSKCQESYQTDELTRALKCCKNREIFSANDFRDTLEYFRKSEPTPVLESVELPIKYSVVRAQIRPVSVYNSVMAGGEKL
jgi:hypothetical protein